MPPYYQKHIFVCENRRDAEECCAARPAADGALKTLREILKTQNEHRTGHMRVNRAGCFNRCAEGPVLAVYPEGVWYRYNDENDLREIAQSHLLGGEIVERLRLPDAPEKT